MKLLHDFRVALSFLTRIPIHHKHEPNIGKAAVWFPVVGIVVGSVVGSVAWICTQFTSPMAASAIAICIGMLITGAFHEDGLADVADAFVGGWSSEDRLRILKDPLHGTYGVAALVGSVAIRIIAFGSINPKNMFVSAIVVHCLARCTALILMLTTSPARKQGLGADYVQSLPRKAAVCSIAIALLFCALLIQVEFVLCFVALALMTAVIRWWSQKKIQGVTGDVLGAMEQVAEITSYVVLSSQ